MRVLALDIGSSSIKAAMLRHGKPAGTITRTVYPTSRDGVRAEVNPRTLLRAVSTAITSLPGVRDADVLSLAVMSPACVALDSKGRALSPIITHQDRRSIDDARFILEEVGEKAILNITGNIPFPGGISSTTLRWLLRNDPAVRRKLACFGHLNTFIHRALTGTCVIDPGNASFTGLYKTLRLGGWADEMLGLLKIPESAMPQIVEGDAIAGTVTSSASRRFGLRQGLPVTTGVIDTSAAMLVAGMAEGRLLHVCGTTDVLALCTKNPQPHPNLLTRALGMGGYLASVSTLASAGSTLQWAKNTLFSELTDDAFHRLCKRVLRRNPSPAARFEPYLGGDRTRIEQRHGAFAGLTLDTNREAMLHAILTGLASASAARFPLLLKGQRVLRDVLVSGGAGTLLASLFHADLPRRLRYHEKNEATLQGLWKLAGRVR